MQCINNKVKGKIIARAQHRHLKFLDKNPTADTEIPNSDTEIPNSMYYDWDVKISLHPDRGVACYTDLLNFSIARTGML